MSQAGRYQLGSGVLPPIETLTGNTGGAVGPDASFNINVVGDAVNITIAGNPSTNTLTASLTNFTNHALVLGNSAGGLSSLAVATNGEIPIGSTGANAVLATITAGTGINVSNGAGSITISNTGGTVTSISEGTGIVCTPNPITGTGTVALAIPVVVSSGGTGDTSFTAYSVICGGTTSTGALQNVSGLGTSGQVLTSNGASALPSWQSAGGSGITTLDGDSGSATGSTVTISGGTTGLTTSASGSTMDLTGTLIVGNGGTGATTLTGVITGNGTSPFTASAITQHDVLVGGASNAITSITNGTTGQLFTATTGSNPSWQNAPASSISITGDSGGALVGAAFTFTGGSTGLTFSGATATETLVGTLNVGHGGTGATTLTGLLTGNGTSAITATAITQYNVLTAGASNVPNSVAPSATSGVPLISQGSASQPVFGTAVVAGGGTGDTSFTAYAPVCGGTSTTGALQSASTGMSNSGYVLTSNGSSSLPSWQAATGGIASVNIQAFTSSGTYTPTSGMLYCIVEVLGGGGGGGGAQATTGAGGAQAASGGGGGAGGYSRGVFSAATIGASQSVTIGTAGTAGTAGNNAGGTGGTTSLGSLISATGGSGGGGGAAGLTSGGVGGAGGIGSSGTINTNGASGALGIGLYITGISSNVWSGKGADSAFGGGGLSVFIGASTSVAGNAGAVYGSGGSGGASQAAGLAAAGGAGTAGLVIVTEYI